MKKNGDFYRPFDYFRRGGVAPRRCRRPADRKKELVTNQKFWRNKK